MVWTHKPIIIYDSLVIYASFLKILMYSKQAKENKH